MKRILIVFVVAALFNCTINAQGSDNPPAVEGASSLYQQGLSLKEQQKINEAANKFEAALKLDPTFADAAYELAWCRNDQKDYPAAIKYLRIALPAMSTHYKVNFELGYAFEKTNKTDSAVYYYTKAISIAPDNAGVYKQMGTIAYNDEDYSSGLDYFTKYEQRVKTPVTDYLYWYRKGFMYNATKDYSSAIAPLKKSLEFKQDYINTYLELGFANKNLRESDAAISYYNQAIQIDAQNYIPYNGIGEVYRDLLKDMDRSMSWYQKALDIKPTERKANFGIGYCLNSKEQFSAAVPYLKKAIENEKTYTAAYVELGYALFKTGNNPEAITNLKKAIELNPKNENSRYYLGLIYIKQGDKINAQKMVSELKTLNSKNAASLEDKVNSM